MTTHVAASYEITGWDEEVIFDLEGAKLVRTKVGKTFSGDLEGTSDADLLMAHSAGGTAAYCGFELVTATLGGRSGTFLVQHSASGTTSGGTGSWPIVPGSGTGELVGLSGTTEFIRHEDGTHTFTVDYDLD